MAKMVHGVKHFKPLLHCMCLHSIMCRIISMNVTVSHNRGYSICERFVWFFLLKF